MKSLQIGKSNTLTFIKASPDLTVTSITVYDSSNNTLLETITPTSDTTSVALTSAAAIGAYQLQLDSAVEVNRSYVLRHNPATSGPDVTIEVYAISPTHLADIKHPLSRAIAAGTLVTGVTVTGSYTPSATLSTRSVHIHLIFSDASEIVEEYLLNSKTVECPIKSADVMRKWSAIRDQAPEWQRRTGVDWQPQIDEAWNKLSDSLAVENINIHNIRSVSFLKNAMWALIGEELTSMGYDPAGSENRDDMIRMFKQDVTNELRYLKSTPIWIDTDDSGIASAANTRPAYWLMGHERTDRTLR
jgi:hypothetical protein